MRGIVLLMAASAFTCGCTSTPPQQNSREVRRPERLVPLGIVHTERTTDVVTVLENVEYALFPGAPVSSSQAVPAPAHPMPAAVRIGAARPNIDYAPLMQDARLHHVQQCVPSK